MHHLATTSGITKLVRAHDIYEMAPSTQVLLTDGVLDSKKGNYCFVYLFNRKIQYSSVDGVKEEKEFDKGGEERCRIYMMPEYDITVNIFKISIMPSNELSQSPDNLDGVEQDHQTSDVYIIKFVEGQHEEMPFKSTNVPSHVNSAVFFVDMRKFKSKLIKKYEKLIRNKIIEKLKKKIGV